MHVFGPRFIPPTSACCYALHPPPLLILNPVLMPCFCSAQVPAVLKVLLDRLRNDTTRLPAVKAFTIISASPLDIPLSGVIEQVLLELTGFLRKANRSLRQAALAALDALAAKSGSQLQAAGAVLGLGFWVGAAQGELLQNKYSCGQKSAHCKACGIAAGHLHPANTTRVMLQLLQQLWSVVVVHHASVPVLYCLQM